MVAKFEDEDVSKTGWTHKNTWNFLTQNWFACGIVSMLSCANIIFDSPMMFIPAAAELCKINTVISEMGQMQMPGDVIGFKKHRFFFQPRCQKFSKKKSIKVFDFNQLTFQKNSFTMFVKALLWQKLSQAPKHNGQS